MCIRSSHNLTLFVILVTFTHICVIVPGTVAVAGTMTFTMLYKSSRLIPHNDYHLVLVKKLHGYFFIRVSMMRWKLKRKFGHVIIILNGHVIILQTLKDRHDTYISPHNNQVYKRLDSALRQLYPIHPHNAIYPKIQNILHV